MRILAIESSCDETGAAVVEKINDSLRILSNITATSAGLHARTGGIIPEDAARKQIQVIVPVVNIALEEARVSTEQIDAVAVTVGPGLIGSLLVGVETAKTLAYLWKKPIVPVNHMLGHLYATWIDSTPPLPALVLIVSGGHTDLVYMKKYGDIELVGSTRDDAAGECFDKCARLLGLNYPGGAKISALAKSYIEKNPDKKLTMLPRPMIDDKSFDWSFSGLKTAALNEIKKILEKEGSKLRLSDYEEIAKNKKVQSEAKKLSAEIEEAICDVLVTKAMRAVQTYKPKSFLLSGGVAANRRLRVMFEEALKSYPTGITLHVPEPKYCTDNAAMIGAAALYNYSPTHWEEVAANPQLTIVG